MVRYAKKPGAMRADELERLNIPGKVTELIRGQLVVRDPPGTGHGLIAATICIVLGNFVRREKLGAVFAQDTGFKIESNPDTVRAPDVAYLSNAPLSAVARRGYAAVAPDLAVEVLSPEDRARDVGNKVESWLRAGSKLVWVVDQDREEVRVHQPDGSVRILGCNDFLDGADVLPGFTCSVRDFLR